MSSVGPPEEELPEGTEGADEAVGGGLSSKRTNVDHKPPKRRRREASLLNAGGGMGGKPVSAHFAGLDLLQPPRATGTWVLQL